jgi:hypothetical protein
MATQTCSPGTVAQEVYYGTAWSNIDNCKVQDGSVASVYTNAYAGTDYLIFTNFGFSIPSGSTINSIEVKIKCYEDSSFIDIVFAESYIRHSGTNYGFGSLSLFGQSLSATNTYYTDTGLETVGYTPDPLWGTAFGTTEINSSSFGYTLLFNPMDTVYGYIYVDHVEIVIDYTASGGGATPFTTVNFH